MFVNQSIINRLSGKESRECGLCHRSVSSLKPYAADSFGEADSLEVCDICNGLYLLGKDILDRPAAELLGLEVKSMDDILTDDECVVAPAVGTSVMMNRYLND